MAEQQSKKTLSAASSHQSLNMLPSPLQPKLQEKLANLSVGSSCTSSAVRPATAVPSSITNPAMPRALKQSTMQDIEAAKQPDRLLMMKPQSIPAVVSNTEAPGKPTAVVSVAPVLAKPSNPVTPSPPVATACAVVPPASSNAGLQAILNRHRFNVGAKKVVDTPASPTVPAPTPTADVATTPPTPAVPVQTIAAAVVQPKPAAMVQPKPAAVVQPSPEVSVSPVAAPSVAPATKQPPPAAAAAWQQTVTFDTTTVQSLTVQHIDQDDPTIVWTTLVANEQACLQMLAEMNGTLDPQRSPGIGASDVAVGRLFAVPFEEVYYRAVVLQDDSAVNELYFQLIDYGNKLFVAIDLVKQPLPVMLVQPQYGLRVRLRGRQRPPAIGDTLQVRLSEAVRGVHAAEVVQPTANALPSVKSAPIVSTCVQPPVQVATAVVVEPPAAQATLPITVAVPADRPVASAVAAPTTFTMDDMTVLPLPTGQPTKLSCLDSSELHLGLITAAAFDPARLCHVTQVMTQQIADYCNGPLAQPIVPRMGDLCLAIFEEDANWYRALCVDASRPDVVRVMFIDYGNITDVAVQNLRGITAELVAEPCLANACVIDGECEVGKPGRITIFNESTLQ